MNESEIIEKYKNKILEQYCVKNKKFEEWLEALHNKSIAFDNICDSYIIDSKKKENKSYEEEVKKQTNFVYEESIKGKKRDGLIGEECMCCKKYFVDNKSSIKNSSRHRRKYEKSKTPPEYYDIDF